MLSHCTKMTNSSPVSAGETLFTPQLNLVSNVYMKKFNNAKTPGLSCKRILFQGCWTDTSAACQPDEMCKLCQRSSAGRQGKLEAI